MQRCTLRLLVLWRNPIGSLFLSPHTRHYILFSDFPCPLCSLLWISGLWHSTEIDSLSVVGFFRRLLRLLIIIRPDTPIFLTGEQISVFFGAFYIVLLCWYLLTVRFRPKHSAFRCCCFDYGPNRTSRENSSVKRKSDFLRLVLPLMYPSSH